MSVSVSFDLFLFSLFCLKQLLHVFVLGLYQEIICMYSILAVEYILWCLDQSHNTSWGMLFLFPEYGSLRLPLFNHECFFLFFPFFLGYKFFHMSFMHKPLKSNLILGRKCINAVKLNARSSNTWVTFTLSQHFSLSDF